MSYFAKISFKRVSGRYIERFFQELKAEILKPEVQNEIVEENYIYSPYQKEDIFLFDKADPNLEYNEFRWKKENRKIEVETEFWINRLFQFPWFFLKRQNVLGVIGVPDCLDKMFNCTVCFQDSTEQDYDYEDWNGIPLFEKIAEKWKTLPIEKLVKKCDLEQNLRKKEVAKENEKRIDYVRKSACYNEIWNRLPNIEDTTKIIYFSVFGYYDTGVYEYQAKFYEKVREEYFRFFPERRKETEENK